MICLSILGTGNYQPVAYSFENETAAKSPYFLRSVKDLLSPEKIFVLMTKEAKEKHSKTLQKDIGKFETVDIPFGKNESEMWELFETIADIIPDNSELIIDITHGFRSQPLLILSVVIFLQTTKNISVKHVLYGAYDAQTNGIAPVFDLKPFLDIINWSFATKDYLKTGNSNEINDIISEIQRIAFKTNQENKPKGLISLGKSLQDVSDAIALIRPQNLLEMAIQLDKNIEKASKDIFTNPRVKPLKQLLDKINENYEPYKIDKSELFEARGLNAQIRLVEHYLNTSQYQRAATLARELLVTIVCLKENFDPISKRKDGEDILNNFMILSKAGKKIDTDYNHIVQIWNGIANIRNDINHAGMRKQPLNSANLKKNIIENCQSVIDILDNFRE